MSKNLFPSVIVMLLFNMVNEIAYAQAPDWQWAKAFGGMNGNDFGESVVSDAQGNIYTLGSFQGTVDFDPGPNEFNLKSDDFSSTFISKLDAAGNFVWAKAIGGGANYDIGKYIAVDDNCNVYITGHIEGSRDFDPGPGKYNLKAAGSNDVFISKLDPSGNLLWAKAMGGMNGAAFGQCVQVDAWGNVFAIGYFYGTVDFDPDSSRTLNLTSNGVHDIFISKVDSLGNLVWARVIGGINTDLGQSLVIDISGNVYAAGVFEGTVDFNTGIGNYNLVSKADRSVFICKLDLYGNFLWAKAIVGNNINAVSSISLDNLNNIYCIGQFKGTTDFDPDSSTIFNLTSVDDYDVFISKFDSSGNFLFAKSWGGNGEDIGIAIDIDGSENIYTTGKFTGLVDFDPDFLRSFNLNSFGNYDIFLSKLDRSGNFIWAKGLEIQGPDFVNSIALDPLNDLNIVGHFSSSTIEFGSTLLRNSDSIDITRDSRDIFIAKLKNAFSGVEKRIQNNNIAIYPNPVQNPLIISFDNIIKTADITITDITGKIVYSITENEIRKLELNLDLIIKNDLVLFIKIHTPDFVTTKKIVMLR